MHFSTVSVASGIFPLRMGIGIFPGSAEKVFLEMKCFRSWLMGEKYCYSCYQYFPANHKLKGRRYPIKGNQSWIFIGSTDVEAPILWPPNSKNWLNGKDPDAWKDWRQEEKGTTEKEMVGWHHRLNGHEFEQALAAGDGQGSLSRCSPWGRKELDITEWLNWTEMSNIFKTKLF